jgi:cellulose synthase/poly-beta-1,6-N-acetylglucosamine synthase-like glycosyltransferase
MITTIAVAVIVVSMGFSCLYAALIVLYRRRINTRDLTLPHYPKVSVFMALRNLDDGLEENVTSIFSLDYPNYDVYFAVDTMEDPCVDVLERVRARFPQVRSFIVAAGHSLGDNPKVSKLVQLERRSDAPLFWVLDSDVRVAAETLRALVGEHLHRDARIVFSPIRCRGARTFGSIIEMSYVNFFLSGSILTAWKLFRQRVVVGKSLLIERKTLDHFGGFAYFSDILAEDHWLGETFARSGFPVRCNYTWVDNIKETSTVKCYFDRMTRWAKLRFNLMRPAYLFEILLNPLALVLLFLPVLKASVLPVALTVIFLRLALEYLVFFAVNDSDRRRIPVILALAPAALVKDLLLLVVYFVPFFSHTITWRGGTTRIGKNTRIPSTGETASMTTCEQSAAVVAVMMGMGHLRAAYPLQHFTQEGVLIYGSKHSAPESEYRIWRKIRKSYYFFSRAGEMPFIGDLLLRVLVWLESIEPYYPRRDHSRPNIPVLYLERLIRRRGLCRALTEKIQQNRMPVVHTYFATAIAADRSPGEKGKNYLLICDSDFNRIWVPKDPRKSNLLYLAPCTQVKRRLISYGVPEENIFLTGFPLPRENIGSETGLEILKEDLFNRLLRLDPSCRFFQIHLKSVLHWLDRQDVPEARDRCFTVTFAVGGAGAQTELAFAILRSLKRPIREGRVRFILSVGIQKRIFENALKQVNRLGLSGELGKGLQVIFDADPFIYLDKFNACLRHTDVLWTKPSELVFYSGLGLPIVMAPPIGTHEELNKHWLQEVHAGVEPAGPPELCHEWLFDLRESGRLAEAAWDGFLKVRKLGTFKIERLIRQGTFDGGRSPLEQ